MAASGMLSALDDARNSLYAAAHFAAPSSAQATAISATTLATMVQEITHITIFTHQLWHSLRSRAEQAADNEQYPEALREMLTQLTDRARETARLAGIAIKSAQQLGDITKAINDARRDLKQCPECAEPAIRAVPVDLTPQQRSDDVRPSYAHRDRTQLCAVVGDHGYEPAEPIPLQFSM